MTSKISEVIFNNNSFVPICQRDAERLNHMIKVTQKKNQNSSLTKKYGCDLSHGINAQK